MLRAVIFDLYGVLGLNGWQEFKERHFEGRWNEWEPLRILGQQVDAGEADDEQFVAELARVTGESESAVRYSFEHTQPNRTLLHYIRENLAEYKIGLLSNASRDVLPKLFDEEERALFDAAVMSAHEGVTKPDSRIFTTILERLAVRPEECIFVDDQERHLATARSMGMRTILFTDTIQAIRELNELRAS